jgi:hypothetical protein
MSADSRDIASLIGGNPRYSYSAAGGPWARFAPLGAIALRPAASPLNPGFSLLGSATQISVPWAPALYSSPPSGDFRQVWYVGNNVYKEHNASVFRVNRQNIICTQEAALVTADMSNLYIEKSLASWVLLFCWK